MDRTGTKAALCEAGLYLLLEDCAAGEAFLRRMEGAFFDVAMLADEEKALRLMRSRPADKQLWITSGQNMIDRLTERGIAVIGYEGQGRRLSCPYIFQGLAEVSFFELERIYDRYHGIPWQIAETKRCLLREFSMKDLDDLFALYAKPHVTDYLEPLFVYEKEKEYEKNYIEHIYGYYGYGMWLVFYKETGELIGRAGLESREGCRPGEAELGYLIAPEYQRQGIATEVCKEILCYAKAQLGMEKIFSRVHEDNTASHVLMKALGFRRAGRIGEEILFEKELQNV